VKSWCDNWKAIRDAKKAGEKQPLPENSKLKTGKFQLKNDGGQSAKSEKTSRMSQKPKQEVKEDEAKSQGISEVPLEQSIYDDQRVFEAEINPDDNQSYKENIQIDKLIKEEERTVTTRSIDDQIISELNKLIRDKGEGTVQIELFCQEF
jgi:hypothetical protein